jgi:hypothetical protein
MLGYLIGEMNVKEKRTVVDGPFAAQLDYVRLGELA